MRRESCTGTPEATGHSAGVVNVLKGTGSKFYIQSSHYILHYILPILQGVFTSSTLC